MSLFYVLRPDNVLEEFPVFTRFGKLDQCLASAKRRAARCRGRVYETTGHDTVLKADYWTSPAPVAKRSGREYRQARANAALFGATV